LYKKIINLTDPFQAKSQVLYLDKTGNVLVEKEEIKGRWKEYFRELFKEHYIPLPDNDIKMPILAHQKVRIPDE